MSSLVLMLLLTLKKRTQKCTLHLPLEDIIVRIFLNLRIVVGESRPFPHTVHKKSVLERKGGKVHLEAGSAFFVSRAPLIS